MGGENGCDGSWRIYFVYWTQMTWNKRTTALKQYQADFPWTENKEVFCFTSSVSSTRSFEWNLEPLIPEQIVNLFGQGKCTFDCQSGNFKNYSSGTVSTRSCMLRIEKLINFNMTCMWTFHTNSLLHGGICFSYMYTNNCEHFDKWFGTLYRDNSVLMRVLDTS